MEGNSPWDLLFAVRRGRHLPRGSLEGQRGFEPCRVAAHLQLGDPLDPAVPAIARSDEPQGEAVSSGERFVLDVGGQEEVARLFEREAAGGNRGGGENPG